MTAYLTLEVIIINTAKTITKYLAAAVAGFLICYIAFPRTITVTEYQTVKGDAKTATKTEIVYVPKIIDSSGQREKTDLQIDLSKTDLNVKVNGKDAVISKTDDEQYLFEKNKIALQQSSKAEINIKVPVVDNTKNWAFGIGYGNHGLAGALDFPVGKSSFSGWAYADKDTKSAGVKVKF